MSSDFIVGMCGESEESYEKSLDLIRECRFKNSFIFKYSPRPGTKAIDLWTDDVPEEVKRHRNNEMLDLQNQISEEDNANLIGSTFEVLVEGISKSARKAQAAEGLGDSFVPFNSEAEPATGPTQLVGRTRCDRIVVFDGNPRLAGSLAEISIDDCSATTLMGHIVTHEAEHLHFALPVVS